MSIVEWTFQMHNQFVLNHVTYEEK